MSLLRTIAREALGTVGDILRNLLGWLLAIVVAGLVVGTLLGVAWLVTR